MSITEINAINAAYPVAGIDQASQGFRDNFSNIKVALTDIDTVLVPIVASIDGIGDVDTTSVAPVSTDFLSFDGANWVPTTALDTTLLADTTPQLGGNLDVNGFSIGDGTLSVITISPTTSAVNYITLANAITTAYPTFTATGSDTDIGINVNTKGLGEFIIEVTGGTDATIASGSATTLTVKAGSASTLTLRGGTNSAGTGGNAILRGGDSTGAGGAGGSVVIRTGAPNGAGAEGNIDIRDGADLVIARFTKIDTGTPVNFIKMQNNITTVDPIISTAGADTNIGLSVLTKGTGVLNVLGTTTYEANVSLDDDIPNKLFCDNNYADLEKTINAQVGTTYTLLLADADTFVTLTNAAAIALTVPTNAVAAFPIGTTIRITQGGAGKATISGAGVTLSSSGGLLSVAAQWGVVNLIKIATDQWVISGDLIA